MKKDTKSTAREESKEGSRVESREDKASKIEADIYDGVVRVVTEADVLDEDYGSLVVAAGAVVGQLYDFSNLRYVQRGRIEDDVQKRNQAKARVGDGEKVLPPFTSEAEAEAMGFGPDAEPGTKLDEQELKGGGESVVKKATE